MSFVIYNNKSFHRFSLRGTETFATERAAKAVLTKAVNAGKANRDEWTVASYEQWVAADPIIEVPSVMSGKMVEIRASQRGNRAVDPSMEGYWTM